jgi:hypothetical protein
MRKSKGWGDPRQALSGKKCIIFNIHCNQNQLFAVLTYMEGIILDCNLMRYPIPGFINIALTWENG